MKNSISVCLSPELVHLEPLKGKIVVVIDIFRATSCMVTGLANGVKEIVPVASVEECFAHKKEGYFLAGERNADKVEGFDIDNSPFSYMQDFLKGQKVCVTTTNGTHALNKAKPDARQIVIGAFLNFNAVVNHIRKENKDVVLLCSAWKGRPCLEDTLMAGAICSELENEFNIAEDAALMASTIWEKAEANPLGYLEGSSHYKRLASKGIKKDLEHALTLNLYDNLPVLVDSKRLVNLE